MRTPLAPLALLAALLPGCFLVPTQAVECSARRPCEGGRLCDPETSTCVDPPPDLGSAPEPEPGPRECESDCEPCRSNAECPVSQLCDSYRSTQLGGSCLRLAEVVYVDNRNGTCVPGTGTGDSPNSPLCALTEGLSRAITTQRKAVRVAASTADYGPVLLSGRGLTVYGPAGEGGRARLGGTVGVDAVTVSQGADVTLDGFEIARGEAGVSCDGRDSDTRVRLRRMRIQGVSSIGVLVSNCRLEVDRTYLSGNGGGALQIAGAREYFITNSYIVRNNPTGQPAIKLGGTSPFYSFRFNTVADNMPRFAAAIDCGGRFLKIEDSIVVANARVAGSQLQSGCVPRSTVVGPGDSVVGVPAAQRAQPRFVRVGDIEYGLGADDPMTKMCCIDESEDKVTTDYFGTHRPLGERSDIGAHEAR